jgi:hypothetical protein
MRWARNSERWTHRAFLDALALGVGVGVADAPNPARIGATGLPLPPEHAVTANVEAPTAMASINELDEARKQRMGYTHIGRASKKLCAYTSRPWFKRDDRVPFRTPISIGSTQVIRTSECKSLGRFFDRLANSSGVRSSTSYVGDSCCNRRATP